jgi:hypothetical protein
MTPTPFCSATRGYDSCHLRLGHDGAHRTWLLDPDGKSFRDSWPNEDASEVITQPTDRSGLISEDR